MREVLAAIDDWVAHGEDIVVATVVRVRRSAPRPPGSKLAINARGDIAGAVSGGCVEGRIVEAAEGILAGGDACLLTFGMSDREAWGDGLPCGGEIDVWVERLVT